MPSLSPFAKSCADWGKEHSNAPRRCVWNSMLTLDYHSLQRQREKVMLSVLEQRLLHPERLKTAKWPHDRFHFALLAFVLVHAEDERCGRLRKLAADRGGNSPAARAAQPPAAEGSGTCGPLAAYDSPRLPYRWLMGLPSGSPPLSTRDAQTARRFEIMHIADYWPGPVWLYHAPGSGVWWDPGPRRVVARNLVDALLRFHPMQTLLDHLAWVSRGDRRVERFRAYVQWRVAYGETPWETVLAGAAAGNATYAPFASAGALLGQLLTLNPPANVDSILLTEQSHFWPRGPGWPLGDEGYAPFMVAPCGAGVMEGAGLPGRTHVVPDRGAAHTPRAPTPARVRRAERTAHAAATPRHALCAR